MLARSTFSSSTKLPEVSFRMSVFFPPLLLEATQTSVRGLGAFNETLRRAATHLVLLWLEALPTLVRFPQQVDANLYVRLICLSL